MPYTAERQPPIIKPATQQPTDPAHSAAIIFLHGLGDDAHGWEDIANQFQRAGKLPYAQWIFPNATENRDAMQMAWYTPTSLNPPPHGRPELADDEDEEGLLASVRYVESLLDDLTSNGIPPGRIVLGGFSQGCALSLLTELTSSYAGKLAGIVGLMGYLPMPTRLQPLRSEAGLPAVVGEVPVFLARGGSDRLVPRTKWEESLKHLQALGVTEEAALELHVYQGLGHTVSPELLKDLSVWLEKVVPALD